MAKIDRVEDLPEWFDLEKYRCTGSFGVVDWFECLDVRKWALFDHPNFLSEISRRASPDATSEDFYNAWSERLKVRAEELREVRENPLWCRIYGEASPSSWLSHPGNQPVRDITTLDLRMQAESDQHGAENGLCGRDLAERWTAITGHSPVPVNCDFHLPLEFRDYFLFQPIPNAALLVDMRTPDALLKRAFDSWLKNARASHQLGARKPRTPLFDRWARYGLLPYLDLLIWSLETETHIPDRVMSAAISHYDAGETNLRKTIAPLAAHLMIDLSELETLALIEAAAQAPAEPETFED